MSYDQNAGQSGNFMVVNKYFVNVVKFKYMGTAVTNKNYIHEEIKRRLISGGGCLLLFSS